MLPGFGRLTRTTGGSASSSATASPRTGPAPRLPGTFGHFGGSGTFLWVDPEAGSRRALTDREFGGWAKEAWPRLGDAVLAEYGTQ